MNNNEEKNLRKKPALPQQWIVPIKLLIVVVLAACSAYVYFNVRDLDTTHIFILLPIVIVSAMAWLDCKMSERYWKEKDAKEE